MLRFKESSDDDKKKFARLLYRQFYRDGEWRFNGNEIAKIDGWPKRLDIENFEIRAVGSDYVCFEAGGDWQQMTLCSVKKAFNKNTLRIVPFDYYSEMNAVDIAAGLE
jgi:hypothetical protein